MSNTYVSYICQQGSNPTVFRSLWITGAVLILVAVPFYRSSGAFYTLLSLGVAFLLIGTFLWAYSQQQRPPVQVVKAEVAAPVVQTSSLAQIPMPISRHQMETFSHTITPTPPPSPTAPAPTLKSAISKKDKKKKKKSLRVSELPEIKEFDKTEAASTVSSNRSMPVVNPKPLITQAIYSPSYFHTYPSFEDIKMERERFTNLPETPDIDRHRRVGMLQEYALSLGQERDGYMIPIVAKA